MRISAFILLSLTLTTITGQEKHNWQRVYSYEDSVVEMNEASVIFVNSDVSRVTFRTVYSKPQNMKEKPDIKYKTRLETIEYKCAQRRYRIYQVTLLDSKGKPVDSYEMDQNEEWKTARAEGIMERLMGFGCRLVVERKRNT
jgi:hypothetical protein